MDSETLEQIIVSWGHAHPLVGLLNEDVGSLAQDIRDAGWKSPEEVRKLKSKIQSMRDILKEIGDSRSLKNGVVLAQNYLSEESEG